MKFRDEMVILSVTEYKDLQQDVEYNKKNANLFQQENNILKKELYSLTDKYTVLEKSRNKLLEKIQQDQILILEAIQGVGESLGVGSSE